MPLTHTGRLVRPGGLEHPSLPDIAVGLSRQPRFAGQGKRWWSVLDHTLFCDELVKQELDGFSQPNEARLAVLLHDAHECITADVPTDFKTGGFKAQQDVLDIVIHDAFFPGGRAHYLHFDYASTVKHFDRRALCAEAQVVGPPAEKTRILELFGSTDELWDDVKFLDRLLERYGGFGIQTYTPWGIPPLSSHQASHPQVKRYLDQIVALL